MKFFNNYFLQSKMKKTISTILLLCLMLSPVTLSAKKKKQNKKTTVEQVQTAATPAKEEVKVFALSNPVKQLAGEWTIKKLRGKNISTSERAYINFDVTNAKIYGSNGCNFINGKFSLNGTSITFSDITATHKSCNDHSASRNIMKAIAETGNLIINEENGIEYLVLRSKSNHELLRLKRNNFDFANGPWCVSEIAGESTSALDMRLVVDTDQLSIHGDTGCNIFNGIITIDGDKYHAIQFEDLISSRKPCENISYETALLVALEETVSARLDNDGRLLLIDNKGNVVAVFTQLKLSAQSLK